MQQLELQDVYCSSLQHLVKHYMDKFTIFIESDKYKVYLEFRNGDLCLSYEKDGIERYVDLQSGKVSMQVPRLSRSQLKIDDPDKSRLCNHEI